MKRKLLRWMAVITASTILGAMSMGCAWSIGGGKDRTTSVQPTRGQELLDLKRARDQGAMTQEEYENQKKQILAR
jgi:hypothetical protein